MNDRRDGAPESNLWPTTMLLAFGLGILLFLIAIEREEWFHIKPFSGAAQAMFLSSDKNLSEDRP